METIKWAVNHMPKTEDANLPVMALSEVEKARTFHESFPQYSVTPLVKLNHMAEKLGLGSLYIKDESYRFGLNAFKVLGGSFAMARYIAQQTGKDVSELPYQVLTSEALKKEFGQATFFTATDGNHGRGVAWAANKLGQKAVVLMPKGSTQTRLNNIRKEGATATIEECNYDECVRMAADMAARTEHGIIVQDTAWDGYEEIPAWIMQGYGTMVMEADAQLHEDGCEAPTHVFIQAGVGSLAGAVQGYFANRYPKTPPKVVVVEAESAACLYKGAVAGDGAIRIVDGDMPTIMAGLACGEPNTISWDILKNHPPHPSIFLLSVSKEMHLPVLLPQAILCRMEIPFLSFFSADFPYALLFYFPYFFCILCARVSPNSSASFLLPLVFSTNQFSSDSLQYSPVI